MVTAASWHALDFVAAVLAQDDVVGRERARRALLATPERSVYALGTLLLFVADVHRWPPVVGGELVRQAAADFAGGVLKPDPEARDAAVAMLVRSPGAGLDALGDVIFELAGIDAEQRIRHMLAMGSLRAVVPE